MKKLGLLLFGGLFISIFLSPAVAVPHYNTSGMSCAKVQSVLKSHGTALLRYRALRNPSHVDYDFYTSGGGRCKTGGTGRRASVPTADKRSCPVHRCVKTIHGGGR